MSTDAWAATLRESVKQIRKGFTVKKGTGAGKVWLSYKPPRTPGVKAATATLPIVWESRCVLDVLNRATEINQFMDDGATFREAAAMADRGDAIDQPAGTVNRKWKKVADLFEHHKLNFGNTIQQSTFNNQYRPTINKAVTLMSSDQAPKCGYDLIEAIVVEWKPGQPARARAAQYLSQFLSFGCNRKHLPPEYQPPTDLKDLIGAVRKTATGELEVEKKKGCTCSDGELLAVIRDIERMVTHARMPKDQKAARQWANALKLTATYGLRPEELRHLEMRGDELWCTYRKKAGGRMTDPRKLQPLPLVDPKTGEATTWHVELVAELAAGTLEMPTLSVTRKGAQSMRQYLETKKSWIRLSEEKGAANEHLRTYSFRHSYSLRGHERGISVESMAMAMGHSYETHVREYPWASQGRADDEFAAAAKVVVRSA